MATGSAFVKHGQRWRRIAHACVAVCIAALAAGCRSHPVFQMQPISVPEKEPIWSGSPSRMAEESYFSGKSLRDQFAHEIVQQERREDIPLEADWPFRVGVALSGGGARAAAYSMGVLRALWEEDMLTQEIDVVSTVSGGGYAAYWYYSRLADFYLESQRSTPGRKERGEKGVSEIGEDKRTDDFFCECTPFRYSGLLRAQDLPADPNACGAICPAADPRWLTSDGKDRWRYQNHVRGYADVLSNDFEMGLQSEDLSWDIAKGLGLTLVTLPGYAFTNLLFDWRLEVSPTQRQYRLGIERTYGLKPVDMSVAAESGCGSDVISDRPDECERERPIPNRLVGRGVTFATLYLARKEQQAEFERLRKQNRSNAEIYDLRPRVPLLVVNTTAGVSRSPFDLLEQTLPDFEDSIFEFTPAGYGSRLYGYWPGSHPDIDVAKSVSASAAFFDSQQRQMSWPKRVGAAFLFRSLQLEWGIDIANPWQPDRVRGRHSFLPFPFYILHRKTKNPEAPYIHLADGGQSDNTGIFSLVRRGVRVIIFADAGQDRDGRFADLCVLRRQLKRKMLHLYIPTLAIASEDPKVARDFATECDAGTSGDRGQTRSYPIWEFAAGALEGCITRNIADTSCNAEEDGGYRARLYILKPSLNIDQSLTANVESCLATAKDTQLYHDFMERLGTDACRDAASDAESKQHGMPAELFGYLVRNWGERKGGNLLFPQHVTWRITLNSSSSMFGAYQSLGRWHMQQLLDHQPLLKDGSARRNFDLLLTNPPRQRTYMQAIGGAIRPTTQGH
jgi:hypothetical protein